ncbi:MAG: PDZ domain-containing protein [Candidatus Acidiferrales bacterium]|jgi:C-terminal processing protease CtpA/Prc
MKHFQCSNLVGWGLLLVAMGMTPGALPGRTAEHAPQQTTNTPTSVAASASTSATPVTSASPDQERCLHRDVSPEVPLEQIDQAVRSIDSAEIERAVRQDLRENLANLKQRVRQEVEMSSPEMQRLQNLSAQLRMNQSQFDASASELATRAAELADLAQEKSLEVQGSGVFVSSDEDGGGWLGVEIGEVTAEKAKELKLTAERGVVVMDVEPDGPAAKVGLKENDVITQYDGQVVEGTVQFRRLVRETPTGRPVALVISRNGATQDISVELGERSAFFEKRLKGKMRDFDNAFSFSMPNQDFTLAIPPVDARMPSLGINAEDLSGQLGTYFGVPDGSGILIREVRSGTAADKAGLKAGDVIVKVDGKPVRTLADLRAELRGKSDQKTVALGIIRKSAEMGVTVGIERPQPSESSHVVRRAEL